MDVQSVSLLTISISLFVLSVSIFIGRTSYSRGNRYFGIALFASSAWTLTSLLTHETSSQANAYILTRTSFSLSLLTALFLLLFSEVFPTANKIRKSKLLGYWGVSLVILGFTAFSDLIIQGVEQRPEQLSYEKTVVGEFFVVYGVVVISFLALIVRNFLRSLRSQRGVFKDQVKYILIGTSVSMVLGILIALVLPLLGVRDFGYLAPFTPTVTMAVIWYVIFKHRFMDIRLFLSLSIELLILMVYTYSAFYFVAAIEERFLGGIHSKESLIYGLVFSILFIFSIKWISKRFADLYLIPNFSYESFSIKLNRLLGSVLDKYQVVDLFTDFLLSHLKVQNLVIVYTAKVGKSLSNIVLKDTRGRRKRGDEYREIPNEVLHDYFKDRLSILVTDEILLEEGFSVNQKSNEMYVALKSLGVEAVVPLIFDDKVMGYVIIGAKHSGSGFSVQDVKLIESLVLPFTFALQRSILYSETRRFTQVLQQRVSEATKVLRKQKEELQDKYQFERDMMGIMGHELRTPMTVAKGMSELVIAKANADKLDRQYVMEKMSTIYESIIKEADLIQTMLSTSHIDNNKMNLQVSEVNIGDIIEYSVEAFKQDAQEKGLQLTYIKPDFSIPTIVSDASRLQEVVNNLVSNAVKYTNEGFVKISLKQMDGYVAIDVADSGIGIPKKEMRNIGRKFYRIHQHLDNEKHVVRAGGTGLGLYVVKGLLKALGGELEVESEYGKGSTFTAILPLNAQFKDNVFITNKPVDKNDMFEQLGFKLPE